MEVIHRLLAYAAGAVVVVGIAWSALLVRSGRAATRTGQFERFQAGVVSLLVVASASGVLLLITGGTPSDPLHLLYAAIALAIIPLARSFFGRLSGRREGIVLLSAFAVIGAVVYRLFTTG